MPYPYLCFETPWWTHHWVRGGFLPEKKKYCTQSKFKLRTSQKQHTWHDNLAGNRFLLSITFLCSASLCEIGPWFSLPQIDLGGGGGSFVNKCRHVSIYQFTISHFHFLLLWLNCHNVSNSRRTTMLLSAVQLKVIMTMPKSTDAHRGETPNW